MTDPIPTFEALSIEERITDIEKRLYQIENIVLTLGPVIDMAREYEDRLGIIEKLLLRSKTMAVKGMKTNKVKLNAMKKVKNKVPAKQKVKMPKPAALRKAGR